MLNSALHFSSCWKAEARDWTASCSTEGKVMEEKSRQGNTCSTEKVRRSEKDSSTWRKKDKVRELQFFVAVNLQSVGYLCSGEYFEEDRLEVDPIRIHPGAAPLHLFPQKINQIHGRFITSSW